MASVSPTPNSDRSLYFDAPIAIFGSHHTDMSNIAANNNNETTITTMPEPVQLQDTGVVPTPPPQHPQSITSPKPNGFIDLDHTQNDYLADNTEANTAANKELQHHPYEAHSNSQQPNPAAESAGWLPAVDEPLLTATQHAQANGQANANNTHGSTYGGSGIGRSNTLTNRSFSRAESLKRGTSIKSRRSLFTDGEGQPVQGSMFLGGASTTGPLSVAERDPQLMARSASADEKLTPKQRSKAQKAEGEFR
jgi:hypothetical protein